LLGFKLSMDFRVASESHFWNHDTQMLRLE
jgi:hypothetical protein